ncbi:hypothetical protein Tco_0176380, partial [Tanacetum coccineum]
DYVPGPKHPPSPVEVPYVPEPEYPEYLVPTDVEAPLEDQPLHVDASSTALSPGYMADFDPDKDLEEDPEEDHADYPADGGDGMDKSKITRKQSKTSKHGHENQKSTKPKPKEAKPQPKP